MVTLGKIQCAIVAHLLEMRFNSQLGVIGRTLAASVEENVKLNLQSANIFLEARQAVFGRYLVLVSAGLVLFAALLGEPG